jgi:hypothetical protein
MADKKESTTKLDLSTDHNINGVQYNAGEGVEVRSEHVEALKENEENWGKHREYVTTHHGAVPAPAHPQEATAQTPTRPLAGPEVRQEITVTPTVNEGSLAVVDDKGQIKEVDSKSAAVKEAKAVEEGKTFDNQA